MYDKDKVKELVEPEDIFALLEHLGAEPTDHGGFFTAKTICHGGSSEKLYYYCNSTLFQCFTNCGDSFDVFELVRKVKQIDLNQAILYVVNFLNLQWKLDDADADYDINPDLEILKKWQEIDNLEPRENNKIVLPEIDKDILKHFPQPHIICWEKEGITKPVCEEMDIKYNPLNGSILIPHYDEDNRLVGIRQRTLVQEEETKGKYMPARLNGKLFNHPLSFSLYAFNQTKEHIKEFETAIVFESEKSTMLYSSYFGSENNISVACCGNSLSRYQFQLLLDAGAKEVVIAFDKDFAELGDDDCRRVMERLIKLNNKYKNDANISILFDKEGVLGLKDSPIDKGPAVFEHLFKNRIIL
jgi:hypothetical protein